MAYWLFKSEPDECSLDDIAAAPQQTLCWEGIRNYQARNFIRDQIALNDHVFIYHSRCRPTAIVGLVQIVSAAYPDPAQFDAGSPYFDPKSNSDHPRWFSIDIQFEQRFANPFTLAQVKMTPALAELALLKQGRLSVSPVTPEQATTIFSHCRSTP
jgi:predicted RNA-binding protein with PUA-like domain